MCPTFMQIIFLDTLQDNTMSKAAELANLIGNINAGGGDNFIINGGMTISQRGSSFTNPSSNAYCLDRYAIQWSGISPQFTVSQDTSTPDGEGFYLSLIHI